MSFAKYFSKQSKIFHGVKNTEFFAKECHFFPISPPREPHCLNKHLLVPQSTDGFDSHHKSNMLVSNTLKKWGKSSF